MRHAPLPRHARSILAVPLLLLAGCGGDGPRGLGLLVRDSAGVRIVEYAEVPEHAAPLTLSPEPVRRYGGGAGDYLFAGIWDGVLFPDGRSAVFDARNSEIVLFGPDDAGYRVLAGPGEGPGEVGFVPGMFAMGMDSLLVEDDGNARFTLFVDGTVARSVGLQGNRVLSRDLRVLGIDASGRLLMSSASYRRGFPDDWLPGHMVRLDLDVLVPDTVASYDWVPFRPPDDEAENPFAHVGWVGAAAGRFVHGRTDTPELVWHRSDGTVSQVLRWRPDWVHPTDEHWQAFEADLRVTLPAINPQLQTEAAIEDMIQRALAGYRVEPDQPLPLFGPFFGDDEGRVWLPEYGVASQRHGYDSYTLISATGEWLGKVDAPPGLRILDVAHGRVLGVVMDEMDVESVVVYELAGS